MKHLEREVSNETRCVDRESNVGEGEKEDHDIDWRDVIGANGSIMDFLPSYCEDGEQKEVGYERRCDEVDGEVEFSESAMFAILVDRIASVDEAQC